MSTNIRRRCPAPRRGVRTPRLALEALEPRCACAAGRVNPTGALLPARPAEGAVGVVAHRVETMIVTVGAKGLTFTPRAGAPFTGAVAQVDLAPASQDAAAGFFANIWWGNGFSTAGVIQLAGHGGYDVIGSMTYSDPGDYQVMIELAGPDGARVTAVSLAHVEPAAAPDVDVVPPASEGDPKGQDTPDPP